MKAKAQRRGKLPLWQPVKAWHSHEWVPFKEAWQRVEASGGGALWLTQRDLRQAFVDGRLIAAVRRIAPDGTETVIILEPAFWQPVKINYAWSITGWEAWRREGEQWVFVVRRKDLDKLCPASTPSEHPADNLRPSPRRRGPVVTHDWFSICGEIARRCIDPKNSRVRVLRTKASLPVTCSNGLRTRT